MQYTGYNTYNIQDIIQYNIQYTIHTIYRIQCIQYNVQCTQNIMQYRGYATNGKTFVLLCIWFQTINGIF